jgi:hypothetical protein
MMTLKVSFIVKLDAPDDYENYEAWINEAPASIEDIEERAEV